VPTTQGQVSVHCCFFYPVPLFIMMLFAGGSSGDAFLSQIIGALAFGGAILQFPLYGFIISLCKVETIILA